MERSACLPSHCPFQQRSITIRSSWRAYAADDTWKLDSWTLVETKFAPLWIDTDHTGVRTGEFDDSVNLVPGDYFLGWASDAEIEVHSLGEGYADQLALMNAGGGAVGAGVGQSRDNALPDKLGVITPGLPSAPILAYFKG